uniref:Glycerophosphocholine acyltransferase 1 n=1 Tax=Acrobeloides nanus TaxID=290746 RepID=A0A914DVV4_9BILA
MMASLWLATTIDPAYQQFIDSKGPQKDPHAMFLNQAMQKQDSAFLISIQGNPWAYFYIFWALSCVIQSLYIGLISFNLIPIHAILIYICMIANMRPYRNFLLKVAMRTVGMKGAETTSTVVGTNSKVIKGLDTRRQTLETSKNTKQAWN